MEDSKQLWDNALLEIELNVSKANFSTWFKHTYISKQEAGVIYLSVPNEFVKDWLSNKYHKFILKSLRNIDFDIKRLEYLISPKEKRVIEKQKEDSINNNFSNKLLPLDDLYVNKEDNLNPKYVFDSFIIGSFNELAHAASQAIIKKPGMVYNPLFVHGDTGLGKTHLIQAIGNYIKNNNKDRKIYYTTSEKFSMDYINSIQNNKVHIFKEKYRKYDVLIMDDIQFFSNKEKFQEELFHLFNTLYDNNKQIIFSSDKHPNYLSGLEDRLKSRFGAGMIIEILKPDYESRLAILKNKLGLNNIFISDNIIDFIASTFKGNIRELEGILNTVICQSQLKNRNLTLNDIKPLIKNSNKPKKILPINEVVKIVSNFYNVEEDSIYEKTRRKEVVKARQVIMYILRKDFNISYPLIGRKLGGRDHTTVIHSYEKISANLKVDNLLNQELDQIKSIF